MAGARQFLAYLRANPQESVRRALATCGVSRETLDEWREEPEFGAAYQEIAAERRMPAPVSTVSPSQARQVLGWVMGAPQERTVAAACREFGCSYKGLHRLADADDEVGYLLEQAELAVAVPVEDVHHRMLLADDKRGDGARAAYLARKLAPDYGSPAAATEPRQQQVNVLVQIASDRLAGAPHDGQGYVPKGLDPARLRADSELKMLEPKRPETIELPSLAQLEGAPS